MAGPDRGTWKSPPEKLNRISEQSFLKVLRLHMDVQTGTQNMDVISITVSQTLLVDTQPIVALLTQENSHKLAFTLWEG
jgi:hypothetical protein